MKVASSTVETSCHVSDQAVPLFKALAFGLVLTWLAGIALDTAQAQQPSARHLEEINRLTPKMDASSSKPLSEFQLLPRIPYPAVPASEVTVIPPQIDRQLESTVLGFEKSVAPWPGRRVTFQGKQYQVMKIEEANGGPMLSRYGWVIGVQGSSLLVSLKEVEPLDDRPVPDASVASQRQEQEEPVSIAGVDNAATARHRFHGLRIITADNMSVEWK